MSLVKMEEALTQVVQLAVEENLTEEQGKEVKAVAVEMGEWVIRRASGDAQVALVSTLLLGACMLAAARELVERARDTREKGEGDEQGA